MIFDLFAVRLALPLPARCVGLRVKLQHVEYGVEGNLDKDFVGVLQNLAESLEEALRDNVPEEININIHLLPTISQ